MDFGGRGNGEASAQGAGHRNRCSEQQTGRCGDPNVALSAGLRPPKTLPGRGRCGSRARTREGIKGRSEFVTVREAILGFFCQASSDDAIERFWHRRIVIGGRRRPGATEACAGDRCSASGEGRVIRRRRSGRRRYLAIGQRGRKCALRESMTGVEGCDGHGQRHNEAADHQGRFSGKDQRGLSCSDRSTISDNGFLRLLDALNNPSNRATARRRATSANICP